MHIHTNKVLSARWVSGFGSASVRKLVFDSWKILFLPFLPDYVVVNSGMLNIWQKMKFLKLIFSNQKKSLFQVLPIIWLLIQSSTTITVHILSETSDMFFLSLNNNSGITNSDYIAWCPFLCMHSVLKIEKYFFVKSISRKNAFRNRFDGKNFFPWNQIL